MSTARFDCPEGSRLIIQRPGDYFTALVQGKVVLNVDLVPCYAPHAGPDVPYEIVGARVDLHFELDEEEDGTLYRIAHGKYEEK